MAVTVILHEAPDGQLMHLGLLTDDGPGWSLRRTSQGLNFLLLGIFKFSTFNLPLKTL